MITTALREEFGAEEIAEVSDRAHDELFRSKMTTGASTSNTASTVEFNNKRSTLVMDRQISLN